jgi:hypothetical protein
VVYGGGLHREIAPHVEEEGRVKGDQIGATLMHITVKEAKVISAWAWGISQAFPIGKVVVEVRSQETLKGFH